MRIFEARNKLDVKSMSVDDVVEIVNEDVLVYVRRIYGKTQVVVIDLADLDRGCGFVDTLGAEICHAPQLGLISNKLADLYKES